MSANDRLAECEIVIERGLATFVEVGKALAEIRDSGLYKIGHATFEAYCKERWGFSRVHAHRVMEAAETVEMLPIGNKPKTESQARELAKAPKDKQAEVWAEVVADGEPTAAKVKAAVEKYRPPKETEVPKVRIKATLQAIDDLQDRFNRCGMLAEAIPLLDSLRSLLTA